MDVHPKKIRQYGQHSEADNLADGHLVKNFAGCHPANVKANMDTRWFCLWYLSW